MKNNVDKIEDILVYSFGGYPYSSDEQELMDTFEKLGDLYWHTGMPKEKTSNSGYVIEFPDGTRKMADWSGYAFEYVDSFHAIIRLCEPTSVKWYKLPDCKEEI